MFAFALELNLMMGIYDYAFVNQKQNTLHLQFRKNFTE